MEEAEAEEGEWSCEEETARWEREVAVGAELVYLVLALVAMTEERFRPLSPVVVGMLMGWEAGTVARVLTAWKG